MILFAGDSFSANNESNTWVDIVASKFNLKYKNVSFRGSSLYHAYTMIKKNKEDILLKKYDYIIITCTNTQRIPYCPDPTLSYWTGNPSPITSIQTEIEQSLSHFTYYTYFYNNTFHRWIYKKIITELSYEIPFYVKKLIFLSNFNDSVDILKKTYAENPTFLYTELPMFKFANHKDDNIFKNHMDETTNINFGNKLYNELKKTPHGLINLNINELKSIKI